MIHALSMKSIDKDKGSIPYLGCKEGARDGTAILAFSFSSELADLPFPFPSPFVRRFMVRLHFIGSRRTRTTFKFIPSLLALPFLTFSLWRFSHCWAKCYRAKHKMNTNPKEGLYLTYSPLQAYKFNSLWSTTFKNHTMWAWHTHTHIYIYININIKYGILYNIKQWKWTKTLILFTLRGQYTQQCKWRVQARKRWPTAPGQLDEETISNQEP